MKKTLLTLSMLAIICVMISGSSFAEDKHPWADYKPGTMAQWKMKMGAMDMEMTWTVKSNDGKELVYAMTNKVIMNGKEISNTTTDQKIPLEVKKDDVKPADNQWKKTGDETITVEAGEIECEVWEGPNDGKMWKSTKVPFTGVVKMENKMVKQELVKFEVKD